MTKLALKEREDKRAPAAAGPTRAAADKLKKDPGITPQEALGVKRSTAPVAQPKAQSQDLLKGYVSKDGTRLTPFDWKSASPEFKEAWMSKYNELHGTGHQYNIIKPVDKEYLSSRDQRNAPYHPGSENYYANIGATDTYKDGMTVSDFDSLLREQRVNAARLHGEVSNFAERGYLNPFGWFGQKYSPIWHNTQRAINSLSSDDPLQTMLNNEARTWYGKRTGHEIKENEKHINDSERRALATSHVLARTADGMGLGLLPVGSTALGVGLYGAGYTKPNGKPYNIFFGDDTAAGLYANAVYRDTGDIDLARQREAQLRLAGSGGELLGSLATGKAVAGMPGLSPSTASKINTAKNLAYVTAGTDLATDAYSTATGDTDNAMNNKVRPVVTSFVKSVARIPFLGIGASGSKIKDAAQWWLYSLGQDAALNLGEGELPSFTDAVKSGVSAAVYAAAAPAGAKLSPVFSSAVPAAAATTADWAVDTAHSAAQQRSSTYDAITAKQVNGEAYEKRKQQIQTDENAREKYKKQLERENPGLDTKDWTPEEVNAAYTQSVRNQATQTLQDRVLGRLADEGKVDLSSMSQEQASAWLDSVPLEKQQDALAMEAGALISSGAPVDVSLFDVNSGLMRPDQVNELFNSRVIHEATGKLGRVKTASIWLKEGKKGVLKEAIAASPELAAEAEVYMASRVRQDFDSFHSGDAAERDKKKNDDDAQYLSVFSKEQRTSIFQNAFSGKSPDQVIDYITSSAGEGGVDHETAEAVVDSLVNTAADTKNNPGYAGKLILAVSDKLKEGGDKVDPAARDYVIGRIKDLPPEDITKMLETADTKDWEALSSVFTAHAGDDAVPDGFTEEEWEKTKPALVSGVKGLAVKKWKEDPIKNTPMMASFWLKSQGFDSMAEFAENPVLFWGSLVLLLGGTALLGSALFGGSGDKERQPVVINNGPQPGLNNYAQSLV